VTESLRPTRASRSPGLTLPKLLGLPVAAVQVQLQPDDAFDGGVHTRLELTVAAVLILEEEDRLFDGLELLGPVVGQRKAREVE